MSTCDLALSSLIDAETAATEKEIGQNKRMFKKIETKKKRERKLQEQPR
jgi:hypothetical protein